MHLNIRTNTTLHHNKSQSIYSISNKTKKIMINKPWKFKWQPKKNQARTDKTFLLRILFSELNPKHSTFEEKKNVNLFTWRIHTLIYLNDIPISELYNNVSNNHTIFWFLLLLLSGCCMLCFCWLEDLFSTVCVPLFLSFLCLYVCINVCVCVSFFFIPFDFRLVDSRGTTFGSVLATKKN